MTDVRMVKVKVTDRSEYRHPNTHIQIAIPAYELS